MFLFIHAEIFLCDTDNFQSGLILIIKCCIRKTWRLPCVTMKYRVKHAWLTFCSNAMTIRHFSAKHAFPHVISKHILNRKWVHLFLYNARMCNILNNMNHHLHQNVTISYNIIKLLTTQNTYKTVYDSHKHIWMIKKLSNKTKIFHKYV